MIEARGESPRAFFYSFHVLNIVLIINFETKLKRWVEKRENEERIRMKKIDCSQVRTIDD